MTLTSSTLMNQSWLQRSTGEIRELSTLFRAKDIAVPAGHSELFPPWKAITPLRLANFSSSLSSNLSIALLRAMVVTVVVGSTLSNTLRTTLFNSRNLTLILVKMGNAKMAMEEFLKCHHIPESLQTRSHP